MRGAWCVTYAVRDKQDDAGAASHCCGKAGPGNALEDLLERRATLQLKHVLHMLAKELGFPVWETCKGTVDSANTSVLDRYRSELGMFGDDKKNRIADHDTTLSWQRQHGGYLVRYGKQTVAILARPASGSFLPS
jgi:hypothetical protein